MRRGRSGGLPLAAVFALALASSAEATTLDLVEDQRFVDWLCLEGCSFTDSHRPELDFGPFQVDGFLFGSYAHASRFEENRILAEGSVDNGSFASLGSSSFGLEFRVTEPVGFLLAGELSGLREGVPAPLQSFVAVSRLEVVSPFFTRVEDIVRETANGPFELGGRLVPGELYRLFAAAQLQGEIPHSSAAFTFEFRVVPEPALGWPTALLALGLLARRASCRSEARHAANGRRGDPAVRQ